MSTVINIPIELEESDIARLQSVDKLIAKGEILRTFVTECESLIEPKAVFSSLKVRRIIEDEVQLESGQALKSSILSDVLDEGQEVMPYVVTIGPKLESEANRIGGKSLLKAWAMEKVGDYAVRKAALYLRSMSEKKLGRPISNFSPGTGSGKLFSINQQRVLFEILEPFNNIGVRLTPSYLMVPRKSMSGIFAVVNKQNIPCQYCPKECESRRKPFAGEYLTIRCDGVDWFIG